MGRLKVIVCVAAALACSLALAGQASAASFTVDDLSDADDASSDGICDAPAANTCTLRAALTEVNSTIGEDDTITFSVSGAHNISLGALFATQDSGQTLMITGNGQGGGASGTTLDANDTSHVFGAFGAGTVILQDLRIEDGNRPSGGNGGGIEASAFTLTLNRVTVTSNSVSSTGVEGGAGLAALPGTTFLNINDSTVSDNTVTGVAPNGGGIKLNAGSLSVNRSTVSGNVAIGDGTGAGGGIRFPSSGTHTIANSTISGNQSGTGDGGGFAASGGATVNVTNSTIAGNSSTDDGGGFSSFATLTVQNTILADNTAATTGTNCAAILTSPQNNIDSPGDSCGFGTTMGNQENVSAGALALGALADNGGPTLTRALGAGSVARNAGANSICAAAPIDNLDQRGVSRPQEGTCDVGAFEFQPAPPPSGGGTSPAQQAPPAANPQCAALQKKLQKAKRKKRSADTAAEAEKAKKKIRSIRGQLKKLNC